jgi:hypothetical protein
LAEGTGAYIAPLSAFSIVRQASYSQSLSAMVTLPSVTISPVLREAAELTIDELNRGKEAFKKRFLPQVRPVPELDTFTRVTALLDDIAKLRPELNTVEDLEIVAHYVRQGMEDGSVSDSKVLQFEEQIGSDLVKHLNRLELSSLHIELLVEAIDGAEDTASFTKKRQSADLDDDFEVVENWKVSRSRLSRPKTSMSKSWKHFYPNKCPRQRLGHLSIQFATR